MEKIMPESPTAIKMSYATTTFDLFSLHFIIAKAGKCRLIKAHQDEIGFHATNQERLIIQPQPAASPASTLGKEFEPSLPPLFFALKSLTNPPK
jgi:hypothetical protein